MVSSLSVWLFNLKKGLQGIYLIFCGFCIGAADIVPGVSGGTMALILGIYQELIESISDLFSKKIAPWIFIFLICLGMGSAFLSLSKVLHRLLQDPVNSLYLFAAFFGLILGSIRFLMMKITTWNKGNIGLFLVGCLVAFLVTSLPVIEEQTNPIWIYMCGLISVMAMLLPGISGSYLMVILGVYSVIIQALAVRDFSILVPMGLGIISGALIFSRIINKLMKKYPDKMMSTLMGFMCGALWVVWPFELMAPSMNYINSISLGIVTISFFAVFGLETLVRTSYRVNI
ncbi:DUF368 domain-containing protein [Chlamydiales bacterium]|nr:DUF368 domain-containing protein [Chlamydiales bacterium]